jgi:hypothetical protein
MPKSDGAHLFDGCNNLALAGREDGCKIPPIGCADGERVELGRGDNVIGEEAIFRNAARPTRGIEPEESNEAARRCCQGAGCARVLRRFMMFLLLLSKLGLPR